MSRRTVLSSSERESLFGLPENQKYLIQQYTFSESDLSIIQQHRGAANLMSFAVQLCYMRYPGIILGFNETPFPPLLSLVAEQLKMPTTVWNVNTFFDTHGVYLFQDDLLLADMV
jgi:TnpA family transposase